jgi:hypothetical protein
MRETPAPRPRGRKAADAPARAIAPYQANFADLAHKYALLGAKDTKIAELLGVSLRDLMAWQIQHPEFAGMLAAGRDLADAEVVKALFTSAVGYSHPSKKIWMTKLKGADGNEEVEVVEHAFIERFPPNITAAQFFLTNRQPELWRNSSESKISGKMEIEGSGLAALLDLAKAERAKAAADAEPVASADADAV